jgi:hypothetical protein
MARDRDVAAFGERAHGYDEGWRGQLHHQIADRAADLALARVPSPRRILDVVFPDMPAGEVAWMCAAPMRMMAAGDQRTGGDVSAAWAQGLASRREGMQAGDACGSRSTGGSDRGLAGSGDVVGPAAAAGDDADGGGAGCRGGVLRHGSEPRPSVGAAPAGRRLVGQLADPDRGWDAIVIGEYERAFYGNQYASIAPLFEHYGVSLWMPEVGGRVDWHAEDHEQTMMALGLSSKREITRTRVRAGCGPRWPRRRWSRAGISAGACRTGTG